jgi:hypothetical protein
MTIVEGFRIATDIARKELEAASHDNSTDIKLFE